MIFARFAVVLVSLAVSTTLAAGQADPAPSGDRIPGGDGGWEYVVLVSDLDRLPNGRAEGADFHGARVLWSHESDDGALEFVVVSVRNEEAFRSAALRDDNVQVADLNRPVQALFVPNDPFFTDGRDYGDSLIGAEAAWDRTLGTTAVKVGITDTGINKAHADLPWSGGRVTASKDCIDRKADVADGNGHGSHVTGIAAGTTNNGVGVAGVGQSSVIVAQVLNAAGSGSDASVACGVDFVRAQGGHVVSMSLGASSNLSATAAAIRAFWNGGAGGLVVAASGNGGCTGSGCVDFPGRMAEVLAVGAVDSGKDRASFSDGGPELDLVAPGVGVWSTWKKCFGSANCYASLSGTSMATPHVAGVAALVWSANATMSAQQVFDRLTATAEDLGAAGWDSGYGHGMVRADRAVV